MGARALNDNVVAADLYFVDIALNTGKVLCKIAEPGSKIEQMFETHHVFCQFVEYGEIDVYSLIAIIDDQRTLMELCQIAHNTPGIEPFALRDCDRSSFIEEEFIHQKVAMLACAIAQTKADLDVNLECTELKEMMFG